MVGFDEPDELRDIRRREAQRQAPHRSRRDVVPQAGMREMILHQRNHLIRNCRLDADSFEKCACQRASGSFVTMRGPAQNSVALAQSGGSSLREIVRERGE